ncbi:MAG: lytic murein transglycosylase [Rhizobiales bacterium]|nr:lytic murein transglycosylase [Hyphomicrobiales bacterium]
MLLRCPPLSCRISPPHGGRLAVSTLSPFLRRRRLAKPQTTGDLPPCGGDIRQDRGGRLAPAFAFVIGAIALALFATPAIAAKIDDQFRSWLETSLWPEASAKGISRKTFDAAFAGVKPNLKLPDLVLPGQKPKTPKTQHQAEFGSPGAYFAEKTLAPVVSGGRARLSRHAKTLAAVEKRYGVPGTVALAVWGRETGYGAAKIPYDAFEVLGTKAWLATRKEMFRTEVLAALEMVERGLATPERMKSSWAGALGQPQFMPTSFLKYAVDFDGDGKIDIWDSPADVLGSIGNYLHGYGWVRGRDWGFEVNVPASVSCALEGPDRGRKIAGWAKLGIARANGKPFPAKEAKAEGFLLMPAGRDGPAFIVTPNFYVLKQYNMSDLYALFIGHAADRIGGGEASFSAPWGKVGGLYRSDIAAMQHGLQKLGYDVGNPDGLPGFKTRRSIGDWQAKKGEAPTCFPDERIVGALK